MMKKSERDKLLITLNLLLNQYIEDSNNEGIIHKINAIEDELQNYKFDDKMECSVPEWITALFIYLDNEIVRLYWNRYQKEYISPLQNTGASYSNKTFTLKAYDWVDENQYNFKYKNVEISWYKHIGRYMWMNRPVSPHEAIFIFNECLKSIYEDLEENTI